MKPWPVLFPKKVIALFLASAAMAAALSSSRAAILDHEVKPKGADNFTTAQFRLWYPDDIKAVRGVLLLMPGWQGDGRGMAADPRWQQFAKEMDFVIVGGCLKSSEANRYDIAPKGSGKAVLETLADFAKEIQKPELASAPIAIWGHSAGGQFAYSFAGWQPTRVLAFVAVKGGVYLSDPRSSIKAMPALFCAGEKDQEFRIKAVTDIVTHNRKLNAPWCLFVEPGAGHEVGHTLELAKPFLKEAIQLRLGASSASSGFASSSPTPLKVIHGEDGWLVNTDTGEAARYTSYTGTKSKAVWVPSESVATLWKSLSKK